MWHNIKNIASEAIEAARDIKEHIVDVTSGEINTDIPEEHDQEDVEITNNFKLRAIHAEQQLENALNNLKITSREFEELRSRYEEEKGL